MLFDSAQSKQFMAAPRNLKQGTLMGKEYKSIFLRNSLEYLAIFEKRTGLLYEDIAEKLESPLTKSLAEYIALDSKKHATLLKGMAQSITKKSSKPLDLPKGMKDTWNSIEKFQIELTKIETITKDELSNVCTQLNILETSLAAQYNELLDFNLLESLYEELNKDHKISFESIKILLLEAQHDEEHHKSILTLISDFPNAEVNRIDNTPAVSFRNPDGWNRPG